MVTRDSWCCGLVLLASIAVSVPGSLGQDRPAVRASWWDRTQVRTSNYYRIRTDLPLEEAQGYARHFDSMYKEYSTRLYHLPPRVRRPLDVYLFAARDDYTETLKDRFNIDSSNSGGMFFSNRHGSGLAIWTEDLSQRRVEHVIQHEGFHQFAYSRFGINLPVWANEGLAEFFGASILIGDQFVMGQAPESMTKRVKDIVEKEESIPFTEILYMSNREWTDRLRVGTAGSQYQQAWSMVHFLVYGENAKYQSHFEEYLRLLYRGFEPPRAFVMVFGEDIAPFESAWKKYVQTLETGAFTSALDRIFFLASGCLELSHQGRTAQTLDEVRAALRDISFEYTATIRDESALLTADDEEVYRIQADSLCREEPFFEVRRGRTHLSSRRARQWEEEHPMPPDIRTRNLAPYDLQVDWSRDAKTGDISFIIRSR